jgi:hypothetical protein
MKKNKNYVDNAALLKALNEYKKAIRKAKKDDLPKPRIPEYVGEAILKIAQHLSFRPQFINYSTREDFVSAAVLTCIKYIENFNPKISKNAFAYFTQICWFSNIQYIQKEKKQSYVKNKLLSESAMDSFALQQYDSVGEGTNTYFDHLRKDYNPEFSESIDKKIEKRKKKKTEKQKKLKGLEKFMR